METFNIHEAKTHFSRLVKRVEQGEEIVIATAGKPVAKIVAYEAPKKWRKGGQWNGRVRISEDFDGPLPPEILRGFVDPDIWPAS